MFSQTRRTALSGPRKGIFSRLVALISLRGQRRALDRLDDRLLDDIGLARSEAQTEAARPLWDVPPSWRR